MQTLVDIPELVRCYPYNPQPKPQGKSGLHTCQLVMELMEVTVHFGQSPVGTCKASCTPCVCAALQQSAQA